MANEWAQLKKIPVHQGFYVNEKTGIIYFRKSIKGRPVKISTGETQISKAKTFVDDYLLGLTSDNIAKSKREKRGVINPLLSDIWQDAINERLPSRTDTTAVRYGSVWRNDLEPFLKGKCASDMTPAFVIAFTNWFIKTHPKRAFFSAHKYLTMLINYMHREGYIQKKLTVPNIDKLNKNKKEKHFRDYTDDEKRRMVEHAVNARMELALIAYQDTGMRKMELLSREWSDIDWDKRTIRVWSQKNKKWRHVPLTERLLHKLEETCCDCESKFIFPSFDGSRHIPSQLLDEDWKNTKKKADIKGRARIHDIRHTFATKTARDGWPIAVACEILDMSADVYMSTYVHITADDIATHLHRSFG